MVAILFQQMIFAKKTLCTLEEIVSSYNILEKVENLVFGLVTK